MRFPMRLMIFLLLSSIATTSFGAPTRLECEEIVMSGRRLGSNLFGRAFTSNAPKEEGVALLRLLDRVDEYSLREIGASVTPWELSLIPHLRTRQEGLYAQIAKLFDRFRLDGFASKFRLPGGEWRGARLAATRAFLDGSLAFDGDYFEKMADLSELRHPRMGNELGLTTLIPSMSACTMYVKSDRGECTATLNYVLKKMKRTNEHVTAGPFLAKILADPSYADPLKKAANKILSKALSYSGPSGGLFDDIYQSFIECGFSRADATEKTWYSILLIMTDGPNLFVLFDWADRGNAMTLFSAAIIASAIPVLNSLTFESGRPYSFPESSHVTCDTGKPYHFWVPAFLTYASIQAGFKARAAIQSGYISDVGYQIFATGYGRKPWKTFSSEWNSTGNNKTRLDLAYAAAGARFGFNPAANGQNIDANFDRLMKAGKVIEPLAEQDALDLTKNPFHKLKMVKRWNAIFSPDVLLDGNH